MKNISIGIFIVRICLFQCALGDEKPLEKIVPRGEAVSGEIMPSSELGERMAGLLKEVRMKVSKSHTVEMTLIAGQTRFTERIDTRITSGFLLAIEKEGNTRELVAFSIEEEKEPATRHVENKWAGVMIARREYDWTELYESILKSSKELLDASPKTVVPETGEFTEVYGQIQFRDGKSHDVSIVTSSPSYNRGVIDFVGYNLFSRFNIHLKKGNDSSIDGYLRGIISSLTKYGFLGPSDDRAGKGEVKE